MRRLFSILLAVFIFAGAIMVSYAQNNGNSYPSTTPTPSDSHTPGSMDMNNSTGTMSNTNNSVGKRGTIKGEVISIDTTNNQIVIRDAKSMSDLTITAPVSDIEKIKEGDMVKVKMKSGDATTAESVKVIKKSKVKSSSY